VTHLVRRATAELVGTAFLVAAVIGSGIAATRLSPDDVGLQLLENSLATGAVLVALILALQPVSAAFNPVVTLVERWYGLITSREAAALIGSLRSHRHDTVAFAVGGWITAAYWFTSSTSFANPAVTIARMFSDTFAGIAPGSAPMFVLMQLVGGAAAAGLVHVLYPRPQELPG
jgi:glycerol uptake facilitator-like aquaporin